MRVAFGEKPVLKVSANCTNKTNMLENNGAHCLPRKCSTSFLLLLSVPFKLTSINSIELLGLLFKDRLTN